MAKSDNIEQKNQTWDDRFEQATEDISTFLWSVFEWEKQEEDYAQDYLAILLISNRYRSRLAEKFIENCPDDYKVYKEKLYHMRIDAEKKLSDQMPEYSKDLTHILKNEFITRIAEIKKLLLKIRDVAIDSDMCNDSEWFSESLQTYAKDFLLQFGDMELIFDELNLSPFNIIDSSLFQEKFHDVERLFKQYFGYFSSKSIINYLKNTRTREYFPDRWWLTKIPEPEDIEENNQAFENIMDEFKNIYQQSRKIETKSCQNMEQSIAYALGELEPEKNQEAVNHIITCSFCTDLVSDTYIAFNDSSEEIESQIPGIKFADEENTENTIYKNRDLQQEQYTINEQQAMFAMTNIAIACKRLIVLKKLKTYQKGIEMSSFSSSSAKSIKCEQLIEIKGKRISTNEVMIKFDENKIISYQTFDFFKDCVFNIIAQKEQEWSIVENEVEYKLEKNHVFLKNISEDNFFWVFDEDTLELEESVIHILDVINEKVELDVGEISTTSIIMGLTII